MKLQRLTQKKLVIFNAGRSKYNSITSSATTSHNYILPYQQGTGNTFLRNNGSGLLSWVPVASTPSLSQLYAACECVDPAIIPGFDSPHKQINNFKKIGDVNFLRVSSTGITISTIGVYDIFFSAQVCLIDADTIFEFNIMRGITVIKSFISSYSANSPNEGSLSPSYRIFYNKIAPGEELINVYHSTKEQWDYNPPTAITLNRSYLSVFSLQ